jgi:hypothetical protein
VRAFKRLDKEEVEVLECDLQRREKDDKDRLGNIKSLISQLNEKFEYPLKFKGAKCEQL